MQIPNNEDLATRNYINFYNALSGPNAPQDYKNPCLTQGVPGADGSAPFNTVGYISASGCCTTPADWKAAKQPLPRAVNNRVTRLTPFTTASKVGANDDGNLQAGVPLDLLGMTKVWGVTPHPKNMWTHGGVHADNVGAWWKDVHGKPFTIRYNGKAWTQNVVLWCRMTGDTYNPAMDAYGAINPAPNGSFISATGTPQANPCKGCSSDAGSGQVFYDGISSGCTDPYTQGCSTRGEGAPLTPALLGNPSGTVKGFADGQSYQYSNPASRVGGCFGTRDMYGPGKYSVLINLPPVAVNNASDPLVVTGYPVVDAKTGEYPVDPKTNANARSGGRGYVFSMWSFSYGEAYTTNAAGATTAYEVAQADPATKIQVRGTDGTLVDVTVGTGENVTMPMPTTGGLFSGDTDDGYYAMHNHEIDIEIPSNTGQVADAGNGLVASGLNTANFNTWLTDQDKDSYEAGTTTFYQQAQATAPRGQFFASVGEDETDQHYHEFSYVWFVDPSEASLDVLPAGTSQTQAKSYVAFYRDGVEIFKAHRFVPRRSGRVIIGMWPAWWGTCHQPMNFNHVYAKIARMEFVPQADITNTLFPGGALVTNAPQMYDQIMPSGLTTTSEIKCGFDTNITFRRAMSIQGTGAGTAPGGGGTTGSKSSFPLWLMIVIAVLGAALVLAIIVAILRRPGAVTVPAIKPSGKLLK
jgi:hypothetical protein